MASTTAMQCMIDLNNQAVVLIQNGYYKMSATVLRSALASGQHQQEQQHSSSDDGEEQNDHHIMDGEATTANSNDTIRRSSRSETKRNRSTSQSETVSSDNNNNNNNSNHSKKKMHASQGHGGKKMFHRRHSLLMQQSIADDTDFVYRRPIHIPSNGQIIVERGDDDNINGDGGGDDDDDDEVNNGRSSNESQDTAIGSNEDGMLKNGHGFFKHRLTESDIECIVLFNLALSFHLAALESSIIYSDSKKQHRMLKKALKLYEMSFNFQVELGVLTLSETLAVVNNCSTIYKKLNQPDRAECFYQRMLSTIMSVVEAGDPDVKNELKDLDGFLHNICSSGLILKHIAAPAA